MEGTSFLKNCRQVRHILVNFSIMYLRWLLVSDHCWWVLRFVCACFNPSVTLTVLLKLVSFKWEVQTIDMLLAANQLRQLSSFRQSNPKPNISIQSVSRDHKMNLGKLILACPFIWPKENEKDELWSRLGHLTDKSMIIVNS